MATTAKIQENTVRLFSVWKAGIRLVKSWHLNKTIAVTKTIERTKINDTAVCNAPDPFTPLMFKNANAIRKKDATKISPA